LLVAVQRPLPQAAVLILLIHRQFLLWVEIPLRTIPQLALREAQQHLVLVTQDILEVLVQPLQALEVVVDHLLEQEQTETILLSPPVQLVQRHQPVAVMAVTAGRVHKAMALMVQHRAAAAGAHIEHFPVREMAVMALPGKFGLLILFPLLPISARVTTLPIRQ
jgi:hypothetical protein